MPKPYLREFRDDVVAVARRRDPNTTLKQIADDFGISESCLTNWLAWAARSPIGAFVALGRKIRCYLDGIEAAMYA